MGVFCSHLTTAQPLNTFISGWNVDTSACVFTPEFRCGSVCRDLWNWSIDNIFTVWASVSQGHRLITHTHAFDERWRIWSELCAAVAWACYCALLSFITTNQCHRNMCWQVCVQQSLLCAVLHRGSDLGAVRSGQGRHHVTGAVKTQRGGVPCVCRRILVVGVEAQPLPAITHVVQREPRTERVRRTGGAAVVTRTQLVQRDGRDGGAVHGQSVARLTGEVREGVWSQPGDHILLRVIFLTAVILQRRGGRGQKVKLTNNKKWMLKIKHLRRLEEITTIIVKKQ